MVLLNSEIIKSVVSRRTKHNPCLLELEGKIRLLFTLLLF